MRSLDQIIKEMYEQPIDEQKQPFYVSVHEYLTFGVMLEERIKQLGQWEGAIKSSNSGHPNFLLCGREVRPQ